MKVFIVMHGELSAGGTVKSVHENFDTAVRSALNIRCCFDGGWRQVNDDEWENGCDFVSVQEWGVKE